MIYIKRAWPYLIKLDSDLPNYSGFFRKSWRIDRIGLWEDCSLNLPEGKTVWQAFRAPVPASELLRGQAKYEQPSGDWRWSGVVLAAQSVGAAVTQVGKRTAYWDFIRKACRYFRERLLIKLHPKCGQASAEWHRGVAQQYGSACGYFGSSVLEDCEFVLTYNSNYAVEAWLAGVNVMQYAPGCFSYTGAVTFTDWTITDEIDNRLDTAIQLLDFCVWRYCFSIETSEEVIAKVINRYRKQEGLYPLSEELSYGASLCEAVAERRP